MDNTLDFVVIGIYFILMSALGFVFKKFNKDTSDYFRAGCRATWWVVGSSLFMGSFSAFTFTGAAGAAFESGWSVAISYVGAVAAYLICFLCLGAWFRQLRCITFPEVLRLRFGERTQQFYAWVFVINALLYGAVCLYSLAVFCAAVYGYNVFLLIVLIGVMILIYSTLGGSWAVMSGAFVQTIILVVFSVLCFALSLWEVGGISGFLTAVKEQGLEDAFALASPNGMFKDNAYSWQWCTALFILSLVQNLSLQSGVRFFGVKDGRDARFAAGFAGLLIFFGMFIWFIPPMVARLLYAEEISQIMIANPPDASYAFISMQLLPKGLTALIVVAMFTATVTSVDIGLNRNAAVVVQDFYPLFCRWFKRMPKKPEELIPLSAMVTVFFGVAIIGLASFFAMQDGVGIFEILLMVMGWFALPMSIPLLLCMFIRKLPPWCAVVSALAGFSASAVSWVLGMNYQQMVFLNSGVTLAAFFVSMLFWKNDPVFMEKVKEFFTRMHTPVRFDDEIGEANDNQQSVILGGFQIVIGLLIQLLLFLPNSGQNRLLIASTGGIFIVIGGVMFARGRKAGGGK